MSRWLATMERSAPGWMRVWAVVLGLGLSGCPEQGVDCGEGLTRCADACVDLTSTAAHCGACGVVCGQGQACAGGSCQCQQGATLCGGQCSVTASDPEHCGGCGAACAEELVCERSQCKASCSQGFTRCGRSCVELLTDPWNCGACGNACGDAKSCRSGVCTYDVVAACFNTGQIVGIQAGTDLKGPNRPIGERPQTVARMQDVLLVADAAKKLREARLVDYGALPGASATDTAPNQVLVEDPHVYVLNSTSNTLVVYQRRAEPGVLTEGTRFPRGLQLEPVARVDFGANTNPFAMARMGTDLWVTLYGNLGGDVSAGGKVARVSVADPLAPEVSGPYLPLPGGDALQPFTGRSPVPTPSGIVAHRGFLYVALNNLDPSTYTPGGPGLLARIHPETREVRYLPLGEDCLNPGWLAPVGDMLLVSCTGRATYDGSFNLLAVEKTAMVMLDARDEVVSVWSLACPEGGAGACPLPSAGRFAVVGQRVYLGDNNAGRIFVAEVSGNQLIERRGLGPGAQSQPIPACQRESGSFSLVGDVIAIP